MAPPTVTELKLQCSDGIVLAAQSWSADSKELQNNNNNAVVDANQRILCLHGWMDNCRSYHYLAPALVADRPHIELVALDFVGHGWSSHKSLDGPPLLLAESVYYVAEALHQLGWTNEKVTLIGHSMGASVACLYAAAFAEQVQKLVLLEGAGPLERNPRDVSKHVRSHVARRLEGNLARGRKKPRVYPTLELAVQTRCQTARNFPGNQWLSTQAATELVLRGTEPVEQSTSSEEEEGTSSATGFRFRHDTRLQWPSLQYLSSEQTSALYQDIQCPTALLLANDGWPFDKSRLEQNLELLRPSLHVTLPGSHHFHADPDTAEAVAQKVLEFLHLDENNKT